MLFILSSLYYLSLALTSIALLVAGMVTAGELYLSIFPISVTSVSDRLLKAFYHTVQLAAIVYCMIVFLLQATGGDINAL